MERVFGSLREKLANQVFDSIEEMQEALTKELKRFWDSPHVLVSLTNYPGWEEAVETTPAPAFKEKRVQFFKELLSPWEEALQGAQ